DRRTHRGAHPEDAQLFSAATLPAIREAAIELCWLLSRGYAPTSALKLVGDRHQLAARQRLAVMRSVCSDGALAYRHANRAAEADLVNARVFIDGFNVLTTVEASLGGAVIIVGRDGSYRDLAG